MSARIGIGGLARIFMSALPEQLRLQIATDALLTIEDRAMVPHLRAVAAVVSDHATVLQARSDVPEFTRFPNHSRRS